MDKALKLINVTYQVLPAILDFRKAKDNAILDPSGGELEGPLSGGSGQPAESLRLRRGG